MFNDDGRCLFGKELLFPRFQWLSLPVFGPIILVKLRTHGTTNAWLNGLHAGQGCACWGAVRLAGRVRCGARVRTDLSRLRVQVPGM